MVRIQPHGDLGNTGVWTQYELAKLLVTLSKGRADCWKIRQLDFVQQSLAKYTALRVKEEEAKVPKAAGAGTAAPNPDEDWSIFDCPLLSSPAHGKASSPSFQKDDAEDWEISSEFTDFMDGLPDEIDMNDGTNHGQKRKLEADHQDAFDDSKDKASEKAVSEAGSIRSAHSTRHIKTVATDMDVVEEALREIGKLLDLFHVWPLTSCLPEFLSTLSQLLCLEAVFCSICMFNSAFTSTLFKLQFTHCCRWPLPDHYRIYHQKAKGTYALFYKNKRQPGTLANISVWKGHKGANWEGTCWMCVLSFNCGCG